MERIDRIIIKYLSESASPEEEALLLTWLEESEQNRIRFRALKDTSDLRRLGLHIAGARTEREWDRFKSGIPNLRRTGRWKVFVRYAAIFILGALSLQITLDSIEKEEPTVTTLVETGVGDRSKITLPDGSTVWINACSSIAYNNSFGETTRTVSLKGEAFFDVKKDSAKPFLVKADKFTYRVTGTSFNVYAFDRDDRVSIALLEGGVDIEYDGVSRKLRPQELFTYDKKSGQVSIRKRDVDMLASWRRGEFVFDDMPFYELARRLERSYNVKFVFENPGIGKETFGGTLRDYDSPETIMKVIQASVPIKYTIDENTIYIR